MALQGEYFRLKNLNSEWLTTTNNSLKIQTMPSVKMVRMGQYDTLARYGNYGKACANLKIICWLTHNRLIKLVPTEFQINKRACLVSTNDVEAFLFEKSIVKQRILFNSRFGSFKLMKSLTLVCG
ncbi:hypothetical protein AH70_00370 [Pediococcus damnosus LMG 28219]|nr:hypothetical protein AH70_00370 [Pediococcus damnosus LMG 28219]PIO81504.1 hypothetical protein BSQ38_07530 [Pediococcus damnosus]PIO84964.1 hypothetical protein BSQ37_03025 [Pediococcus damnosus]PJE48969.1 hypothetical protein BSQ36_02955 [Pediococcus damnosus]